MRRLGKLAFLLAIGFIFLYGCAEEEAILDVNPYATVLGDENAGGYVVLEGQNCFPIGLYIHIDHDTLPLGFISSDEAALLYISPGKHDLSVKSNGAVVIRDKEGRPVSKFYIRWEKEITAEADYAPVVRLDCFEAIIDYVPWEDDNYEPNDSRTGAYDFTADAGRKLALIDGMGQQWDDDWYKISVSSGNTLVEVTCEFTHYLGNIDIELIDIEDNVLSYSNSTTNVESISFVVPSNGIYYIRVYGPNKGNEYDLLWNAVAP